MLPSDDPAVLYQIFTPAAEPASSHWREVSSDHVVPPVGVVMFAKVTSSADWNANTTSPFAVPDGTAHVNVVDCEVVCVWERYAATTTYPQDMRKPPAGGKAMRFFRRSGDEVELEQPSSGPGN